MIISISLLRNISSVNLGSIPTWLNIIHLCLRQCLAHSRCLIKFLSQK